MMLLAAITAITLPLAELPPQPLPAGQCAMFLWDRGSRQRIAMVDAGGLLIMPAAKPLRLPAQSPGTGPDAASPPGKARYGSDALLAETDLAITANPAGGALVRDGSLSFSAPGADMVVLSVAGIIGCQPVAAPPKP
jgi:hypothetical protein